LTPIDDKFRQVHAIRGNDIHPLLREPTFGPASLSYGMTDCNAIVSDAARRGKLLMFGDTVQRYPRQENVRSAYAIEDATLTVLSSKDPVWQNEGDCTLEPAGLRLDSRVIYASTVRKATGDDRYQSAMDFETPSVKAMLKSSSVKAIYMLATEPVVFAFGLWIAFSWFIVFLFLSVIPITFEDKRGWNEGVAGLPYISLCVGVTLGWLAHHVQMKRYARLTADPDHKVVPEDRLWAALYGAPMMPIGKQLFFF